MDGPLLDLARILQPAVRDEMRSVAVEERATLTQNVLHGFPVISLEPERDDAAPLEVHVDSVAQLTLMPGRSGMSAEVVSRDHRQLEDSVREITRAVLAGSYTEIVPSRDDRFQGMARWPRDDGWVVARVNVLRTPQPGSKGWLLVEYSQY